MVFGGRKYFLIKRFIRRKKVEKNKGVFYLLKSVLPQIPCQDIHFFLNKRIYFSRGIINIKVFGGFRVKEIKTNFSEVTHF